MGRVRQSPYKTSMLCHFLKQFANFFLSLQMLNMFLETGSVLRKNGSGRQKEQLKILKRLNKELQRPQINPSGD
jgi:hypothetical protein